MKKFILLSLLVLVAATAFAQTKYDPTSPYDKTAAQKLRTLETWAEGVDAAFEAAESSTNGILASNTVYIGSAANLAVSQPITGDIGITTGGVVSITAGAIENADIATNAAIAQSKLATLAITPALISGGVTTNRLFLSATDTTNTLVISNGVIVAVQ